ncbi:MAG: threonylcarbamoyl-AMP synthase [Fuerstiella sp.]|jgi:L-threonylcarbamoyladenylate synthase|nr:threonylcarbamoyl-AMP synthase [Fuerstiella sp.]MCP4509317.1 threonylcarbamoyl-AMP synthase [Fuerstiella sp.]MDG2127834.1 L-threonylcarbamoyladenylate synthase [Fuerstiella sp.]
MRETVLCKDTSIAAEMLRRGQLVAFPTETVYGLGADATNSESVAGIFESKQRPAFDPLIVHVTDIVAAQQVVVSFSEVAQKVSAEFWPGPLTLVLPKRPQISDLVTAGLPGVGLRIPNHPLAIELLQEVGRPVAAPSANPFGGVSPTTAGHVMDGLGGRIDGILDGGPCEVGLESTVLSLMTDQPTLLRPGGLPVEDIEAVIGAVQRAVSDPTRDEAAQPAPGMLSRHYAPATTLQTIAVHDSAVPAEGKRCGLLTHGKHPYSKEFEQIEQLSGNSDLRTCAANFFAALRSLDSANLDVIIARSFPDTGLGIALNDRLHRAAFV